MGRPKGSPNKDGKEWRAAIRKAVHELRVAEGDDKKIKALGLLADRLVSKGLDGDVTAIKEIGDRLDGKAAQSVALTGDPDSPVTFNLRLADGLKPK